MTETLLDTPLNPPFYGGSAESESTEAGWPVTVGGRGFLVDTEGRPFSQRSIELLNTQQAGGSGDTSSIPPEVWRRVVESWHQGAGQDRYDRAESLPSMFSRSYNIDPWSRYTVSLLNTVTSLQSLAGDALLHVTGTDLHVIEGDDVTTYDGLDDVSPTATVLPAAAVSATTDGQNLYILCSNGVVRKRDSAGTWTTFYTEGSPVTAMALFYVKGFLLIGVGPALKDISSGTPSTIWTHPLAGWGWRAGTDGPSYGYLLGGIGDRWHVYRIGLDETTGVLNPPAQAAPLPEGEVGYTLGSYLNYLLIGTEHGWRFAVPDSGGAVSFGQLTRTAGPVRCFEGQDRFVWFGLSIGAIEVGADATRDLTAFSEQGGLGRMDLSTFTASLTPASAPDLVVDHGDTTAVVTYTEGPGLGRRVFAVSGDAVYVETTTVASTGWLDTGVITFGSTDPKKGAYGQVQTEPMPAGAAVTLQASVDDGAWGTIGFNDRDNTVSLGNCPLPATFQRLGLRLVLSATGESPAVTRVEFRAVNIPGEATEWIIPLVIAEDLDDDGLVRQRDAADDYNFLREIARSRRPFTFYHGKQRTDLYGHNFEWYPTSLTSDERSYRGTFVLIAREMA